MNENIALLAQKVLDGQLLVREDIEGLQNELNSEESIWDLLYWSNKIRLKFFGKKIRVCSIVPGRLGGCDQDCKFCAQSACYETSIGKAELLTDEQILAAAAEAKSKNVPYFGIVYSGRAITEKELARIESLARQITEKYSLGMCASLGIINADQAKRLADAGVSRYNHNLETSENHFAEIVTTHNFADRVNTIKAAQQAGLGICAGGIFGIGEIEADRIDMAFALRDLNVDMIPLNFLHPIPGTPLGDSEPLKPMEILKIVAIYRLILPNAQIKVAGGRVLNLRDLQSWIFYAGATAILTGNYLTTAGRSAEDDMQMLEDLGLDSCPEQNLKPHC